MPSETVVDDRALGPFLVPAIGEQPGLGCRFIQPDMPCRGCLFPRWLALLSRFGRHGGQGAATYLGSLPSPTPVSNGAPATQ